MKQTQPNKKKQICSLYSELIMQEAKKKKKTREENLLPDAT